MLTDQPDWPLPDLRRKPRVFRRAPILSRLGASGDRGAVQSVAESPDDMPTVYGSQLSPRANFAADSERTLLN